MDDLMKEEAKKENFKLSDYFEFSTMEEDETGDLLIDVAIKPLGQKIIDSKKLADPNFNEEDYFQNLIRKALESYIAQNENVLNEEK